MAWGGRMRLPSSSHQAWSAAFCGDYDAPEQQLLTSFIESGTLVLDIGACFGLWTLPLAVAATQAGAQVAAFEPVPVNAAIVRLNLEVNGYSDFVALHEFALGATPGEVVMDVESHGGGNAAVYASGELTPPGPGRATVPVVRLDDVLAAAGRRAVIKIDVEGYELDVLEGGSQFVTEARPVILGEFNPDWFRARGISDCRLADWVGRNDYAAFRVTSRRRSLLTDRRVLHLVAETPALPCADPFLLVPVEQTTDGSPRLPR